MCSVQFSHSVVSDFLRPHESQHARPLCPSPTPGVYSNSCPLSHVILLSVCLCGCTHSTYLLVFTEKKFQKVRHLSVEIDIVIMRGVLCGVFLFSAAYS